jgi:hypothetical protein
MRVACCVKQPQAGFVTYPLHLPRPVPDVKEPASCITQEGINANRRRFGESISFILVTHSLAFSVYVPFSPLPQPRSLLFQSVEAGGLIADGIGKDKAAGVGGNSVGDIAPVSESKVGRGL